MRIVVIGTRGIPNVLGGIETHCQELYPHLVKDFGYEITIVCRKGYVINDDLIDFKGINLKAIYAPQNKIFEAIVHSILAVIWTAFKRPDILHVHGVGPSLVVPFARLLGLKVVMTHHGPDYKRQKWGKFAKAFLKAGELVGVKFSNQIIVISPEIKKSVEEKYKRFDTTLIPNGVSINGKPTLKVEFLQKFGLNPHDYIYSLGRFVPEKGFDYLIKAYEMSGLANRYKLVIAGDADHVTQYSKALKEQAHAAGVILPGFISGQELAQLFSNCALFVLPSFYEGLPIALLEGMAYELSILASNIPANTQVHLPSDSYFPVGNVDILKDKLLKWSHTESTPIKYNMEKYNWKDIAFNTINVYSKIQN